MLYLIAGLFGLFVGSFLNVVIWRLPRDKEITGRSKCLKCDRILQWYELLPVISFLFLKGECRTCATKLSVRYPLFEVVTSVLFIITAYTISPDSLVSWVLLIKSLIIVSSLIAIFSIDYEHYLILDSVLLVTGLLILPVSVIEFTLNSDISSIFYYLLSGVTLSGLFYILWRISKGRWIGFGDVKFGFWLGLFLGPAMTLIMFLLTFWIGTLFSIILIVFKGKQLSDKLPLGTFLSVGAFLALLYGNTLLAQYLRLIGIY